MNEELMAKARAAKSPDELMGVIRENGIEGFPAEAAKNYYDFLNMKSGEISDEEIDVSAGGCNTYGHPTVTCDKNCNCGKWEQGFRYDYEDGDYWPLRLDNQALRSVWHALTVNYRDGHKCGNCRHLGFNSIGTGFCEEQ